MKVKKILILLLIPFFSDMLIACCDCEDPEIFRYTNTSLELRHLDNRGQSPVVASGDIALKEAYGISMTMHGEKTAYKKPPVSLFISRSYAFSCGCNPGVQYHPKDSITGIRIITVEDFDAQHAAGSDISAYFKLYSWNNFTGIDDYLSKEAKVFYYEEQLNITLNALLMQPPPQSGSYRFRVEMALSDGRTFIQETSTIELQ